MTYRTSVKFWRLYRQLPKQIRRLADENFKLLKDNPRHPSLHLKTIGRFWSVRIGTHYRALGVKTQSEIVWFWIGGHAEYDQMIAARQ